MSLDTGCVGRVGMPQKIFNPPPQFSKLGTLCPTLVACLFVSWDWSFLGFFLLLSVLVCYTHIIPCNVIHILVQPNRHASLNRMGGSHSPASAFELKSGNS